MQQGALWSVPAGYMLTCTVDFSLLEHCTIDRDRLFKRLRTEGKRMGFLWVALGGAAGAMGRYAISLLPSKTAFPFLTLFTNIAGAVLIGFITGFVSTRDHVSRNTVLFWKTGVCGGFTTFSTFSLEAWELLESRSYMQGGVYIVLSVAFCVLGVICGKKLALLG